MAPMARFALTYEYADPDLRARVRPRHLDYLGGLHEDGRVVSAGPFGDGSGALVVYEAADLAAAQALVDADPYAVEGVMRAPLLREWKVVLGGS